MIAALGTFAFGQSYASTGQGPSLSLSAPPMMNPSAPSLQDIDRMAFSDQQNRVALSKVSKERLDRAARVEALINENDCGRAAQIARAEHDDAMADQVPKACAAHRAQSHH